MDAAGRRPSGGLGAYARLGTTREQIQEANMSEPRRNNLVQRLEQSGGPGRCRKVLGVGVLAAVCLLLLHTAPGLSQREQPGGGPQGTVDTKALATTYANFCRVQLTPEELILDFGLNTSTAPNPKEPVKLTTRLVMNYYTAKRLSLALQRVVQEHERVYGTIELDFRKRVQPGKRPAGPDTE
jgi:hypothetical protein